MSASATTQVGHKEQVSFCTVDLATRITRGAWPGCVVDRCVLQVERWGSFVSWSCWVCCGCWDCRASSATSVSGKKWVHRAVFKHTAAVSPSAAGFVRVYRTVPFWCHHQPLKCWWMYTPCTGKWYHSTFMAALCNRAGHYIFALWFFLLSVFLSFSP